MISMRLTPAARRPLSDTARALTACARRALCDFDPEAGLPDALFNRMTRSELARNGVIARGRGGSSWHLTPMGRDLHTLLRLTHNEAAA